MSQAVRISLPARLSAEDIPALAQQWLDRDDRFAFLTDLFQSAVEVARPQDIDRLEVNAAIVDQSGLWDHVSKSELIEALKTTNHPTKAWGFAMAGRRSAPLASTIDPDDLVRVPQDRIVRVVLDKPSTSSDVRGRMSLRANEIQRIRKLLAASRAQKRPRRSTASRLGGVSDRYVGRNVRERAAILAKHLGTSEPIAATLFAELIERVDQLEVSVGETVGFLTLKDDLGAGIVFTEDFDADMMSELEAAAQVATEIGRETT